MQQPKNHATGVPRLPESGRPGPSTFVPRIDATSDTRYLLLVAAAAAIGLGLTALDLLTETDSVTLAEFLFDSVEKTLIVIGAVGVFLLIRRTRQQHKEQIALIEALGIAHAEGADWRARTQLYRSGLGEEIARQFRRWGLSEAEQEIGWMLLKGLSHKEISSLRGTAESTVRQQARLLYGKSGLPGKTAFTAFFLEELLPPRE